MTAFEVDEIAVLGLVQGDPLVHRDEGDRLAVVIAEAIEHALVRIREEGSSPTGRVKIQIRDDEGVTMVCATVACRPIIVSAGEPS